MIGGILYNIMEKELDELIARAASWQDKIENENSALSSGDDGDDEWFRLCQEICDKADDYDSRHAAAYDDDDEDDADALLFADYDIDVEDMEGDDDCDDYDADDDDGGDDDGWLD